MMAIHTNCVVSMRYIMMNSDGLVLENTMQSIPLSYLHGTAGILSLLQKQLEGLRAGDRKTVCLQAASGFTSEDFIFEVTIDQVRLALNEEILLGYPVQTAVEVCEADCACYTKTEI